MTRPTLDTIPLLIVDDERANCLLLKKIFEKQGFENVLTTTDPTETAGLYRAHHPGIVLLDINMPQMNGFEVLAQLQEQEGDALAPILVISAQGDQETRVQALQQGARDYVSKPFNQVELVARVENLLALQVAEQQRLHFANHFDPITELPNRDYGLTLLGHLLEESDSTTARMALAVLELESYQRLVQTYGYAVADAFLLTCIERIQSTLAPTPHILGRLEGGSLLIGIRGETAQNYTELTNCAEAILGAVTPPVRLEEAEVRPEPRLGAALFQYDADTVEGLLAEAQSALGQIRGQQDQTLAFADSTANNNLRSRLQLEADLEAALNRHEFFIEYQPQYDLSNARILGAEALIRWQSPERGRVSPGAFIPALEETGLIHEAGKFLIASVFAQLAAWREAGHRALKVAINLSPRQIEGSPLPAILKEALAEHGIPPSAVELEVTESLLLSGKDTTRKALEEMERMGFSIALDDFGTGYSALSYLHNYPFHKVKIDRSFVTAMDTEPKGEPLVRGILNLSHDLGLVTVAEGIEESQQEAKLGEMGCRIGQGFKFCKPVDPAAFEALLAAEPEIGRD